MDGQVSGLETVHPLLTLNFFSIWILPLHVVSSTLKRKSSSSVMDGLQTRRSVCGVVSHWSCVRARSADCRINFAVFLIIVILRHLLVKRCS